MIESIRKRSGDIVPFDPEKITWAIFKAAAAVGGDDWHRADELSRPGGENHFRHRVVDVESVQDTVEKVLIERGHAKTAKAYILYREKRRGAREANALIGATIQMFSDYLGDMDWQIKENANTQKSINGMNNYIRRPSPSSTGSTRSIPRRSARPTFPGTCTSTTWASSAPTAPGGICGCF